MLLAQGFAVKPGVGGWSRHLHGLKLALPCWHRLFLLWGNPYGLTPVAREHPQFFGLSVTTSLQSSVLAISPLPGPFLICPRLLIGLGLALPLLIFSEVFWLPEPWCSQDASLTMMAHRRPCRPLWPPLARPWTLVSGSTIAGLSMGHCSNQG